ncbi:MAG: universal stress protein [Rhodoblastus sp.]|nr:universal stress protein [Rhodoblastus sp.]MCC0004724.1 universal stress protein [Methylobacteriaceae bacterium]
MYRNILVPIADDSLSDSALEHATALSRALGSRLTLMTLAEQPSHDVHEAAQNDPSVREAAILFDRAAHKLRAAGVAFETCVYCGETAWEGITTATDDHGCDLIVMASRGGEHMDGFVFGSVAASVLTRSRVPVLVVRGPA